MPRRRLTSSARAAAVVAPGARRPNTSSSGPRLDAAVSSTRSGTHQLSLTGKAKPSGMTPTTVCAALPSRITRPTTDGSAPKRDVQTSWPITTTGDAPGRSSASSSGRPSRGGTRATRKPDAVISATVTGSTAPEGWIRFRLTARNAPTSSTERSSRRSVATSAGSHRAQSRRRGSALATITTRSPSCSGRSGWT